MLFATVRQRKIQVKSPSTVIQNGINVDELNLEMDDEWGELDAIVAVFTLKYSETDEAGTSIVSKEVSKKMLHTFGKSVMVPWECLAKTGQLMVSFTGYVDGEKVMTTMYPDTFWDVVQSGPVTGDETIEPTASLYEQILAAAGKATLAAIAANEAKDQLLQDKANGVFDGKDGKSAKVSVGSTQTGSEGSEAEVYTTGTEQDLKLHFVIPRGVQGEPGQPGGPGPVGPVGPAGIHYGTEAPTDASHPLWINPEGETELPSKGVNFTVDETLTLSEDGVLSVNTAKEAEADNTLPITSAAVHTTVGNIEILLKTI